MAQVFLTGARGYLGACIALELRRRKVRFEPLSGRLADLTPGSVSASAVIHAAGALRHAGEAVDRCNREGTERLLAGLADQVPVVFASSRSVYGRAKSDEALTEESPVSPADPYGASKAAAERAIVDSGGPFVILRFSTLIGYGVDQAGRSFYAEAGRSFVAGRPVTVFTPDKAHDFMHVHAAATAMVEAALGAGTAERGIYNAAGPIGSLHQLLQDLEAAAAEAGLSPVLKRAPGAPSAWPLLDASAFNARFGHRALPARLAGEVVSGLRTERPAGDD